MPEQITSTEAGPATKEAGAVHSIEVADRVLGTVQAELLTMTEHPVAKLFPIKVTKLVPFRNTGAQSKGGLGFWAYWILHSAIHDKQWSALLMQATLIKIVAVELSFSYQLMDCTICMLFRK